ncbi:MAG: hypothetical protein IKD25_04985 [Bacteroidaceae bacterium]|nr:hypothetical protein [Bacteroidaceae bacterium]
MEIAARLHAKEHAQKAAKEVQNLRDVIIALLHVTVHVLDLQPLPHVRDAETVATKHAHNLAITHVEPDANIHVWEVVTRRVWVDVTRHAWAVALNTANIRVNIHPCKRKLYNGRLSVVSKN